MTTRRVLFVGLFLTGCFACNSKRAETQSDTPADSRPEVVPDSGRPSGDAMPPGDQSGERASVSDATEIGASDDLPVELPGETPSVVDLLEDSSTVEMLAPQDVEPCIPDCNGKECGPDGCNGECGFCWPFMECDEQGKCLVPGKTAGCPGCACESCVCDANPYCCEIEWTPLCSSDCLHRCGGGKVANCGDQHCVWPETCANCVADCSCPEPQICHEGSCCVPTCDGIKCGEDACGMDCGSCPLGAYCVQGQCVFEQLESCCDDAQCGYDPCRPWELCGTCVKGICIEDTCVPIPCELGDYWEHCQDTGEGKSTAVICANGGFHEETCHCKPGWLSCYPISYTPGFPMCATSCLPNCAGKECGDDGCSCPCGLCPAGTMCSTEWDTEFSCLPAP